MCIMILCYFLQRFGNLLNVFKDIDSLLLLDKDRDACSACENKTSKEDCSGQSCNVFVK